MKRYLMLTILGMVVASMVVWLSKHDVDTHRCKPPLDELQETWLMNHPECLDRVRP